MQKKKLVVGITAEGSVNLLLGQLAYFKSLGYKTYLLAPYSERSAKFCQDEGCEHLIVNIEREISLWKDIKTLWQIFWIFKKVHHFLQFLFCFFISSNVCKYNTLILISWLNDTRFCLSKSKGLHSRSFYLSR